MSKSAVQVQTQFIATKKERQALWISIMLDGSQKTLIRVRAFELLLKSQVDLPTELKQFLKDGLNNS